jgi:hypothetical protein
MIGHIMWLLQNEKIIEIGRDMAKSHFYFFQKIISQPKMNRILSKSLFGRKSRLAI